MATNLHSTTLQFLDYKITQQAGLWNSFERELYDMIRAAFLKYSGQCRIGRMDGAFVTYHNTQEIFGFQYVKFLTSRLFCHNRPLRLMFVEG